MARHIAEGGRLAVPAGLSQRITAALDTEDEAASPGRTASAPPHRPAQRRFSTWAQAAAVAACVISGAGGWYAGTNVERQNHLTDDIVQAHVRALVQDNPLQVVSSDSHTVRPWFAGKLEIAPSVADHAAEGFPLMGGRLDYIGATRTGVVVYKHDVHWINVYMWPAADRPDSAPVAITRKGYNMLNWSKGGIALWAVSDANMSELRQLQAML